MQCPNCGASNPDNKKFCTSCGSSLRLRCPACDGENPPEASVACLVPALLGMQLGQVLRRKISEKLFRRCVDVGLIAIGLHLIWKGLW